MNVLVVATHPDDEVLGCGGAIAWHTSQGDRVHVLVVSRGMPELFPPEQIEATRVELREAHRLLGVHETSFLDFPAPKLDAVPGYELADAIGRTLRSFAAELMYIPHRGDIHADHQAVYQACLVAARPINRCPVRRILCYETLSETEWSPPTGSDAFIPTVFINITDYLDLKIRAMDCYKSQLKAPPHPRSLETIAALARVRGSTVDLAAAEAFMLVREIVP